ncbi:MAG: C10 family peptidase [Bacteroidales bacterium]|nr:C10 family peptidase [Bacteroidales bacterium]
MRKFIYLPISLIVVVSFSAGRTQTTQPGDADIIAGKWIQMVIDKDGSWGGHEYAIPGPVEEFLHNGRLIGYYCNIEPVGYIVFSLRKELAPVKAWSYSGNINPLDEEGIASVIKTCMSRIIDTIESRFGNIDNVSPSDMDKMAEIDYRPVWDYIDSYTSGTIEKKKEVADNYQEGEVLLSSDWHQFDPYNNNCPYLGCTTTGNGRALVGCVATAGAQIMKYWSWPPYGVGSPYNDPYDWANMRDVVTTSSPAAQQAAVAELNAEVGQAVSMSYGCEGSGATTSDMVWVYVVNYAYHSSCTYTLRTAHTATGWFDLIKWNMNANRPIQYRIPGHSIVCDGWRETGNPVVKQYHMNYGWVGTGNDTWYTLDALQGGNPVEEYMVLYIVPLTAIGGNLSGTYTAQSFPYRYFDLDASGSSATFNSGQLLQILPGLTIRGYSSLNYVKFYGSSGLHTRIFTEGNLSEGILIQNGAVRLHNNGSIKLQ